MENYLLYIPGALIFILGTSMLKKGMKKYLFIKPLLISFIGVFLILLALYQNMQDKYKAMLCLSIVFILSGLTMLLDYLNLRKMKLIAIEGKIIDIEKRLLSRKGKFKLKDSFTYYPIVEYQINNKTHKVKCNVNSSFESSFKVGSLYKLYYNNKTKEIFERKENIVFAIISIFLLALGTLLTISTILEMINI